jgi:hypothetical protein
MASYGPRIKNKRGIDMYTSQQKKRCKDSFEIYFYAKAKTIVY